MTSSNTDHAMRITLVLLVRNELPCLEVIFPQLPKASAASGFDDIVAFDGESTDGSVEYLQNAGIRVFPQSRRGRGDAFQRAIAEIDSDAYVFFSPDGNEDVADLSRFRPLLEGGYDIVIASRMMEGAVNEEDHQVFRWRKWANNAFNLGANLAFRREGPYITDSINGYRAITREAGRLLELDAVDFAIEFQMTMRAMATGLRIYEFPTIEGQRIAGEIKARSIPTGLRFIQCYAREVYLLFSGHWRSKRRA